MAVDGQVEAQTRRLRRRQHAAATWDQLLHVGWTRAPIRTRVRRGEWQRPFQRVYILGDPEEIALSMQSAALLSVDANSALGHGTGSFLWGFVHARPRLVDLI